MLFVERVPFFNSWTFLVNILFLSQLLWALLGNLTFKLNLSSFSSELYKKNNNFRISICHLRHFQFFIENINN